MKSFLSVLLLACWLTGCSKSTSPTVSDPPLPAYGSLRVVVQDSSGRAVPGAHTILYRSSGSELAIGFTDSTGVLAVDSLQPDTVRIDVERIGYVSSRTRVYVPQAPQEVRIVLALYRGPFCTLQLTVRDTTGVPLAGAKAVVRTDRDTLGSGLSDSSGMVQLDSLQPCWGQVTVSKAGYTAQHREFRLEPYPRQEVFALRRAVPSPVLNFVLTTFDGRTLHGQDLLGDVIIIDFWATWCTPCRQQLQTLQTVDARFRDDGLTILAVAYEDDSTAADTYVRTHRFSFATAMNTPEFFAPFGNPSLSLPTSYVYDRNGELASVHRGSLNLEEWTEQLLPLLHP
jgi:thiol-disulfide isomerase/thioredoxin